MKLQFTSQQYQEDAVASVVDLFHGEGDIARKYVRGGSMLLDSVANVLPLSVEQVQANLHIVQRRNHLPLTDDADRMGFCVEMETGTGKTFVYIETIYQLNARYGLSKFVIVVPSIAIREGVRKFLEMTHEHFQARFDRQPIRWFVYNSVRLGDVREFAQSTGIEVMIINIDAFRKSENIIHQQMDRMNGGRAIDLIRLVRPVVIVDEPQSVDNTPKAKEAMGWLEPLFTLRYSATHRDKLNTVYRLTPVDAYQQGLVKQISVSSISALDGFNQPYVRLVGVDNAHGYKARVEIDVKAASRKITRKTVTAKAGDDLFRLSGEREMYRGWLVSDIDCTLGDEKIDLSNTHTLALGATMGDVSQADVKRGQIRRTIEIHLDKELRLLAQGVKVLSLFFIDQVDRYRAYDGNEPRKGEYATIFEAEYAKLLALPKYAPLREAMPWITDEGAAHGGYFSIDKKGRVKDTRGDTADDQDTYSLIMREKEKLLSFETPLRFIFSHSALKEGWDNPNVFQVCTLLEHSSALSARQKIGRGLRLCVNQAGERVYDKQVNVLHVVASEHFAEFADNLQREIEQDTGVKFGTLDIHSFLDIDVPLETAKQLGLDIPEPASAPAESTAPVAPLAAADMTMPPGPAYPEPALPTFTPPAKPEPIMVKLGDAGARALLETLKKEGVIDKAGRITADAREKIDRDALTLPEAYQPIANPIIAQIREANRKIVVRDAAKAVTVRRKKQVFASPEFNEIWARISQKTKYRVEMNEQAFFEQAAKRIAVMPAIQSARIVEQNADVDVQHNGVVTENVHTKAISTSHDPTPRPDLLSILRAELELRKDAVLEIFSRSGRVRDFLTNPERFLEEAVGILRECKAAMVTDGIRYLRLAGQDYSVQEVFDKDELIAYLGSNAIPVRHSVYDHVVVDSPGVEGRFARDLDNDPQVKLFFKLPPKFAIDTPLGTYNPDWAVLVDTGGEERLYLVLETKGSLSEWARRGTENNKIRCSQRHFEALGEVAYDVATAWNQAKLALVPT